MSAERGPSRGGTMTMSRGGEGGMRSSMSRSVISSPRGESRSISSRISSPNPNLRRLPEFRPSAPNPDRQAKSFNIKNTHPWGETQNKPGGGFSPQKESRPQRTISRREFDTRFGRKWDTHQFSAQRHEATIDRSAVNKIKGEIRSTITQPQRNETKKEFPKMRLYTIREKPGEKVSLIKPVNLEKKTTTGNERNETIRNIPKLKLYELREIPKVSLIKPVRLEKRNTNMSFRAEPGSRQYLAEPRNLIPQKYSRETVVGDPSALVGMTKEKKILHRPVEQPTRHTEKLPKQQTLFLSKQRQEHQIPKSEAIRLPESARFRPRGVQNFEKKRAEFATSTNTKSEKRSASQQTLRKAAGELRSLGRAQEVTRTLGHGNRDENRSIKERIAELIPQHGLEKTHQILVHEGKQVTLEKVFSIAIRHAWDIKIREIKQTQSITQTESTVTSPVQSVAEIKPKQKISLFQEIKNGFVHIAKKEKELKKEAEIKKMLEEAEPKKYIVDLNARAARGNMITGALTNMYFLRPLSDEGWNYKVTGKELGEKLPDKAPGAAMSRLAKIKNKSNDGSYVEWREKLMKEDQELTFFQAMSFSNDLTKEIPPVDLSPRGKEVTEKDVKRVLEDNKQII